MVSSYVRLVHTSPRFSFVFISKNYRLFGIHKQTLVF